MVTQMESRLTILVIMLFSVSFWLLITVIINIFQDCPQYYPNKFQGSQNITEQKFQDVFFKYHFVASLILKTHEKNASDVRICDTSILNSFWTITAAQCLSVFERAKKYHVRIRSNSHDWKIGQEHRIQKYLLHEKYLQNKTNYDFALIRVLEPLVGPKVSYVKIANFSYNYEVNTSAVVVSWSIQNAEATLGTRKLKKFNLLLLEQNYCFDKYKLKQQAGRLVMCAGRYGERTKLCKYDSGAPLIQNKMLVGVASKGVQCGSEELPGLFVKVPYFLRSIKKVLDNGPSYNGRRFIKIDV